MEKTLRGHQSIQGNTSLYEMGFRFCFDGCAGSSLRRSAFSGCSAWFDWSAARGRSAPCIGRRILNPWTTSEVPRLPFRCQSTGLWHQLLKISHSPVNFSLMRRGLTVCLQSTACGSEDGSQASFWIMVAALLHLEARESPDTTLPAEIPTRPF